MPVLDENTPGLSTATINRTLGALDVVGGSLQVGAGALLSSTALGAIAGVPLALSGLDHMQSGARSLFSGDETKTLFVSAAEKMGMSEKAAALTQTAVDLAFVPASIAKNGFFMFGKSTKNLVQLGGENITQSTMYYSKTAEEMAAELQMQIGKNSVPFRTVDKAGHIDLAGKAHYDSLTETRIPTPHVQTYDKHIGPNGKVSISRKTEVVRPATKMDIRIARRLAEQQEMFINNEKTLMNTVIDESNSNIYKRPGL